MSLYGRTKVRNRLLSSLPSNDFEMIAPQLKHEKTVLRQVLIAPHEHIAEVYFPESGFVSITYGEIEVGLVGREGFVGGVPALLGGDTSPYTHVVQMPGEIFSVAVESLRKLLAESSNLSCLLLRFVRAYLIQISHTAYANVSHGNEARLARWLLMCRDRVDGDEIRTTHEYLAQMLGMPRTGVTMGLQALQVAGVVRVQRGSIAILDHAQLVALAGDAYGVPEASYAALFGTA